MNNDQNTEPEIERSDMLPHVIRSASMHGNRHVVWFSCGVASALTAALVKRQTPDAMLVRIRIDSESADNDRFTNDISKWLGCEITVLQSKKYKDHFEVIEDTGWFNGVGGARCTGELKKKVRFEFQQVDDVQYFGYALDEQARAERFVESYPEVIARFPLIETGLTKEDCAGIIASRGIELPEMYRLGYNNNNCIGCVKGGKGYWNKIRITHPEIFKRMSTLERDKGAHCLKEKYLDELKPEEGRHEDFQMACDFVCQATVNSLLPELRTP